jgi:HSP20 family protein
MTDTSHQAIPQADKGDSRRAGRQASGGEQTHENPSFDSAAAGAQAAGQGAKIDVGAPQILGETLKVQQEAAKAGQAALQASQSVVNEFAALWRQSLEPLAVFQNQTRQMFEELWRQTTGMEAGRPLQTARPFAGGAMTALMGAPAADLQETDNLYHLAVEVPGLDEKDLKLGLRGDALVIAGQKTEVRREGGGAYRLSERRYGAFERAFPLPADVDRAAIAAKVENGLLTVNLPKTKASSVAGAGWKPIEVRG